MAGFEFERRAGEKTVIELDEKSVGEHHELTLTVLELTATRCKLRLDGSSAIKRIFKEETLQSGDMVFKRVPPQGGSGTAPPK